MSTNANPGSHIPRTVSASLEARLAPYPRVARAALEDLDVEASRNVTPQAERQGRAGLFNDLKLLFASLGAGNSVVPLGDNSHAARLLAEYANSLRRN
jgi:hypothetical protein